MRRALAATAVGLFAALFASSAGQAADAIKAETAWETIAEFKSPESAAISPDHQAIFVSNVNGYEKNGLGFISKLSLDGDVQELKWLTGLNAPTGLAVDGDTLWAVDYDRLVKISISQRRIVASFPAPDAHETPLLNDVAVGPNGDLFVTGSNSNSIYKLQDNALVRWISDDDLLKYANGIWVGEQQIVVAAYHLISIDRSTRRMRQMGHQGLLFDLEGVKVTVDGTFLVSLIGPRPLYKLSDAGALVPIFHSDPYLADFDIAGGLLVGPTGPDKITALTLQ